jgi:sugar phosphate permease
MTCQFLAFPATLNLVPKKIGGTATSVMNTFTMFGNVLLIRLAGKVIDFSKNHFGNSTYSPQDYKNGMTVILVSLVFAIFTLYFMKDLYPKNSSKD